MSELINVSEMNQAVNTITAQMIVLANNIVSGKEKIDSRIASFEKQTWYKRMWNSLNGKMKGTKEEFEQNKENIVIYILKAITAVYDENKFNQDMLLSIKQKIADIYYLTTVSGIEQILKKDRVAEIRNAAKELSVKINSATENIEVLTLLADEIESGKFNYNNPIATICDITSKLDGSVLCDDNISETVCGAVNNSGIIANSEKTISDFMADVINIPVEKNGEVYLELASMDDNLWASIFAELMESYNMLSKMERMAKKKDAIIKNILEKNDIDEATAFTASDLLETLLATRIEMANMTVSVSFEQSEELFKESNDNSEYINDEDYDEDEEDVDTSYYHICDVDTPYYHIYLDICKFVCRTLHIDEDDLYINKDFKVDDENFIYEITISEIRIRYDIPSIPYEDRKGLRSVDKIAKYIIELLQDEADIYEDVFEAICRYFELDLDEFEMDDDLIDDLCCDMLEIVFMMAELGEKYDIQHIPDNDLYKLRTPRKIISYIKNNR